MMVQTNTPHPIPQYNFLAVVPLLLAIGTERFSRIRKPLSVLKRCLDAESDQFSRRSGDGKIEREKICIWASCLFPSAFFLLFASC